MSYLRSLLFTGERRHGGLSGTSYLSKIARGAGAGWSGVPVTERSALQQSTVFSCAGLLAETLAQLPVGAFRGVGPTRQQIADPPLLTEPYVDMTIDEWIGAGSLSTLLRGNFYGEVVDRNGMGFPTQIEPLHPDECWPLREDGFVRYKVAGRSGTLARGDVFHLKGLTMPGSVRSLKGLSPLEYMANTIGTALAAEEFGARWFGESAMPSGILSTEESIDQDEATEMQGRWEESHGGRHRRPAVLGNGLKWQPLSLTANEAQFLETIKAKREEICGFYRVPPHMVGMVDKSTSWGSGIEEQMLGFVTFSVGIWVIRWERALSRLLPKDQYVKFNLAGLLRGRLSQRYQAYLQGRQGGWLSIDDIRALEDLPPLPDEKGGDYLQPLNYAPIPEGGGPPEPVDVTPVPDSEL